MTNIIETMEHVRENTIDEILIGFKSRYRMLTNETEKTMKKSKKGNRFSQKDSI